ncbi:MAG: right-handed parallel beta-helix repeat-containing protein, partial [Candidatus Bathyarchaeia archaeon]
MDLVSERERPCGDARLLVLSALTAILILSLIGFQISLVRAAELHVGPGQPYTTIQAAVNAANPGDTIIVHPGTYDEQVVVDKSLTIQGYGDTTIVKPSSAAKLTTVLDGQWWNALRKIAGIIVVNVAGGNVVIKNLKVDGEGITAKPTGADYVAGIFYREAGGTIEAITIANVRVGTGTDIRGDCIYLSATTNTVTVEVRGSTMTNFDKNGIDAYGEKLTANIHDNTITGRGPLPSGDEVQNGVVIGEGATGTVNHNTISSMAYQPETWWSTGILFLEAADGSAQGNTITDCQNGVFYQDAGGSASANTVNGGSVGILGLWAQGTTPGSWTITFKGNTVSGMKDSTLPGEGAAAGASVYHPDATLTVDIEDNQLTGGGSTDADGVCIGDIPDYGPAGNIHATIKGNMVSGWNHGINLLSSVASAVITGNTIQNNKAVDSGVHVEDEVSAANVHVNFNNIMGNTDTDSYGVYNGAAGTLDAEYNWWGSATGPYHSTGNPSGTGDKVSDNVDFDPWLLAPTSGGKSETVTGSGSVDAKDEADTEVDISAEGDHTITCVKYTSNPGGPPTFTAVGLYYDVSIDSVAGVDSVTVRFYYTDADIAGFVESSLRAYWWTG